MTNWDRDPGNDQFAQAEAAGFNPYAGPNGRYETPRRSGRDVERERFEQQWQDIINRYDEE
jgi:hypothetical protein